MYRRTCTVVSSVLTIVEITGEIHSQYVGIASMLVWYGLFLKYRSFRYGQNNWTLVPCFHEQVVLLLVSVLLKNNYLIV